MEQRFFDSIGDQAQNAAAEMVQQLKRDDLARSESANGKTREDVKTSYARRLIERLKAKA
jgi:hypothetical protein